MIRVNKPSRPRMLDAGVARTEQDCADFDANRSNYLTGANKFEFKRRIYGHPTVKDALREAQHGKCCFCEGWFEAFAAADVEHYRPKGAARQDKDSPILFPGYYWLAYSWDNLYWCCQECNRSHKKDFFPLAEPTTRARCHRDDIADENPLLLDPGTAENLRSHIEFRRDRAIGLTEAGRKTIQVVGLNRPALIEERQERLKHLYTLQDVIRISRHSTEADDIALLEDACRELDEAVRPKARFSAMAVDFLRGTEPARAEAL